MHGIKSTLGASLYRWRNPDKLVHECPVCDYRGPFRDLSAPTGHRRGAKCPRCGALERHRLQSLVLDRLLAGRDCSQLRMLHFAPERQFRRRFAATFGVYETADLDMPGVDHHVDLQALPFADASYDLVYASHVLEHVPDDAAAIAGIRRVLRPSGMAILPVPLVNPFTVEYLAPNAAETMHVRAPGPDYFDRYRAHFARVELFRSEDFPERHQLYTYEDRTKLPNAQSPLRSPSPGERHSDTVPVCYA